MCKVRNTCVLLSLKPKLTYLRTTVFLTAAALIMASFEWNDFVVLIFAAAGVMAYCAFASANDDGN